MKLHKVLSGGVALLTVCAAAAAAAAPPKSAVTGTYLEARDANVFVGACHFGSEYQSMGRDAILAWHITSGVRDGVSLAGLNVVAVVAGQNNLAVSGAARSSVIYLDENANPAQKAALEALAKEESGTSLGEVRAVHTSAIHFAAAGDTFGIAVPGVVDVNATRLADRACCIMPYRVWYKPLAHVTHPIVGSALRNQYSGHDLNTTWNYPDQNSAFIGTFRA
ncbi:MAG TPA: DUF1326 domain-containing protein [Armatimonadota bacterium]|nr:DUF1326 domain-containing protein [Armatimonadota bacterium]